MALLLWSGGCDSTLLLYDLLNAQKKGDELVGRYITIKATEHIRTISVNDKQVAGSAHARKARDILLPLLRKRFNNRFVHGETTVSRKGLFIDNPNGGLIQPCLWLFHAAGYLDSAEDLYAGYIRGDDIWHYYGWIHQAFAAFQALTHRTGQLKLPLEWIHKSEILHRLKKLRY